MYETVAAWDLNGNAKPIESAIHTMLADKRTLGEHFEDEDDSLVEGIDKLMTAFGIERANFPNIDIKVRRSNNKDAIRERIISELREVLPGNFVVNPTGGNFIRVAYEGNTIYLSHRVNSDPVFQIEGNNVARMEEIATQLLGERSAEYSNGTLRWEPAFEGLKQALEAILRNNVEVLCDAPALSSGISENPESRE
ncbi:hypothetical protein NOR53_591 [gamma proteobacterium NOR5-3]|nr:hypothetical protein NOR53_591 [gamma proteobacterium NOR5-3]